MRDKTPAVSVKVYYGQNMQSTMEIRRFVFAPDPCTGKGGCKLGIYQALLQRLRSLFTGLDLQNIRLHWKDDDGDYVVFSSDDELRAAITSTKDKTLRIYVAEQNPPDNQQCTSSSSCSSSCDYTSPVRNRDSTRTRDRHSSRHAASSTESTWTGPHRSAHSSAPVFKEIAIDAPYGNDSGLTVNSGISCSTTTLLDSSYHTAKVSSNEDSYITCRSAVSEEW